MAMFLIRAWTWLLISFLFAGFAINGNASGDTRTWDKGLLSVKLNNVEVHASSMLSAWEMMSAKYLLRANFYIDAFTEEDQKPFTFSKDETTGNELFDAFLSNYPALTYTQNPETGIIWFHPKGIEYSNILDERIDINRYARNVPMYTGIYSDLCNVLAPQIIDSSILPRTQVYRFTETPRIPASWLYDIDVPAGTYSEIGRAHV